jgi:hypothetical protein
VRTFNGAAPEGSGESRFIADPLTGSAAGKNAGFEKARAEWGKMKRKTDSSEI